MDWTEHLDLVEEAMDAVDKEAELGRFLPSPDSIAESICMIEAVVGEYWAGELCPSPSAEQGEGR